MVRPIILLITILVTGHAYELLYVRNGLTGMNETLRSAASRIPAFRIGAQNNEGRVTVIDQYRDTLEAQYMATVAENSCKWGGTEAAGPGVFNFSKCSRDQDLVTQQGMLFRLHNLCWGNDNPQWILSKNFSASDLEGFLTAHIDAAIKAVGPKSWVTDVVNEPFCNSPSQCDPAGGVFKDVEPWYPTLKDYVSVAFKAARSAADRYGSPNLKLFVNDYSILTSPFKAGRVLEGAKQLKQEGVPLDGVGVQAHMGEAEPNGAAWKTTLQGFRDAGVMVQITEMDTHCGETCTGDAAAKQAKVYGDVLTACLATKPNQTDDPGCGAHLSWGFTDAFSWLNKNGNVHPLPFDENYEPKPAALEMLAVLQNWAAGQRDPTRPWAYSNE